MQCVQFLQNLFIFCLFMTSCNYFIGFIAKCVISEMVKDETN